MEGFPLPSAEQNRETIEKKRLDIPMVDITMKECEPRFKRKETAEQLRAFLDEYFAEAIKNTEIYSSDTFGASFPYAVVRLSELAKALYEKLGSPKNITGNELGVPSASPEEAVEDADISFAKGRPRKEFIFGTMFSIGSAHAFHWVEHGIDQIAKKLPGALNALSRGEEPEDIEIYGMGNPAGELGAVSEEFLDKMGDKPFEYTGELYAEFLNTLSKNEENKESKPVLRLWGVSMGASMAATTAEKLIKEGKGSQSFPDAFKRNIPYVSVNMQAPVGASGSKFQKWQIPLGFAAEIAYQLASNQYGREVGRGEGIFMETIKSELKEKGIEPRLGEEDVQNKSRVISKLLDELRNGIPIAEGLKTNEVIGIYDPLMYSGEFKLAAEQREWEEAGKHSLGESIVPSEPASVRQPADYGAAKENRRRFAINQTHTPAVVRENYFKRLIRAAEAMEKLKK
ncbi:MAG: hypothetical protein WC878_04325 [Candidatus Paceibacterota bacterium]